MMGLIDFVKSAGEMIFGGSDEPEAAGRSPEEVKQAAEAAMASALTQQVRSHGLRCDNLQISFSDEVATVTGTAASLRANSAVTFKPLVSTVTSGTIRPANCTISKKSSRNDASPPNRLTVRAPR